MGSGPPPPRAQPGSKPKHNPEQSAYMWGSGRRTTNRCDHRRMLKREEPIINRTWWAADNRSQTHKSPKNHFHPSLLYCNCNPPNIFVSNHMYAYVMYLYSNRLSL
jgi:hypothetical protein